MKMFDSERKFADFLIANNKTYLFQPPRFKLKKTTYRTDFYCPEDDTYYEIIGSRQAFHLNKIKLIEFIKRYPSINFKIVKPDGREYINREALIDMENNIHPYKNKGWIDIKKEMKELLRIKLEYGLSYEKLTRKIGEISQQTVYRWFIKEHKPNEIMLYRIRKFIKEHKKILSKK